MFVYYNKSKISYSNDTKLYEIVETTKYTGDSATAAQLPGYGAISMDYHPEMPMKASNGVTDVANSPVVVHPAPAGCVGKECRNRGAVPKT